MNEENTMVYPLKPFSFHYDGPVFCKGKGVWLYDENGKKYLDSISGLWNVSFGHSNERINEALHMQLSELSFINLISQTSLVAERYAKRLKKALNSTFSRLIYTCSGSESIECAIKIARKFHRLKGRKDKNKIMIFDMSYHGTTYAAMSASGMDVVEIGNYAPVVDGFVRAKSPFILERENDYEGKKKALLEDLERIFMERDGLAAVLLEPVIASGGIIEVPDWYLNKLTELAEKNDVLVIVDEVATGFGRTGSLFAYQKTGMKPDIICMSKAINNGSVPMGAVMVNDKINQIFSNGNQYIEHFSTQNGNPLACVAAERVLDILEEGEILEEVKKTGAYLLHTLKEQLAGIKMVREIRGTGLMIGIDLVDLKGQPLSLDRLEEIEGTIRKRGLLIYPFSIEGVTGGFSIIPSFYIKQEEVDRIVSILKNVLSRESCRG